MKYKVLIIEDEAGIRKRLIKLIDWDALNCEICGEAGSGLDGLEVIINQKPDIVVSDIVMPGIDGLMLLQYVKEHYHNIQFLVISAYREFDYVQQALKLGASGFLTKPINPDEFKKAISDIVLTLNDEEYKKISQNVYEKKEPSIQDSFISLIKQREVNEHTVAYLKNFIPNEYVIVNFCLDSEEDILIREDIFSSFSGVVAQKLSDLGVQLFCPVSQTYMIAALCPTDNNEFNESSIYAYIKKLCSQIVGFSFSYSVGVSNISRRLEDAPDLFLNSCKALEQRFYSKDEMIYFYGKLQPSADVYDVSELHKALKALPNQPENIMKILSSTDNGLNDPATFKTMTLAAVCMMLNYAAGNDQNYLKMCVKYSKNLSNVMNASHKETVENEYEQICQKIYSIQTGRVSGDRRKTVDAVVDFIKENYAKDIYLALVAEEVFLSPSYLSSLIKTYTNKSFSDLLSTYRIEKAKELLLTDKKISEISCLVGYKDSQYFSTVFKNVVGMTPSEYKKAFTDQ